MKAKNLQHFSRFTDKGPSIAETVIRSRRDLLKKPVSEKGKADWISEFSYVIKQYNNTIHRSIQMSPIEASRSKYEKEIYSILKDKREIFKPKYELGQLVRTADVKRVFSKRDSTNWSYKLYTISEVSHDTIPTYRIDYLPERYRKKMLLPTKVSLDENNQIMKKLNLNQKY